MIALRVRATASRHATGCPCARCKPRGPRAVLSTNAISALTLAGIATGLLIAEAYALITGAPGVPAMFGF